MRVHASTRQQLEGHLGQAEFSLKVTKNFACLRGTPAAEAIKAALAEIEKARLWIREDIAGKVTPEMRTESLQLSVKETRRIIARRLAALSPF